MSKLESLIRQMEIIRLAKKGPFDWNTLDSYLARKEEELDRSLRISKRTFNRDLADIDTLFGLAIDFDFKTAQYMINEEESSEQHLQLLETFDMLQVFGKGGKAPKYLLFEDRRTKGTEYLSTLIHAIEKQKVIQVHYGKYWLWETEERQLKPLALKEFKHRWYVLTLDEKDKFKVFGLDRIHELHVLEDHFEPNKTIDFEAYFRDVFGIINTPGNPVEDVTLTFTEYKGRYIKSLPLHPSQEILVDDANILTIRLRIKIEYELIAEILSQGDEVRVDAPERLKEMVREKAGNVVKGIIK